MLAAARGRATAFLPTVQRRPFGDRAGASRWSGRLGGRAGCGHGEEAKLAERTARRVLIDAGPVRRSRDLRRLVLGELVSEFPQLSVARQSGH
jgi:hypothetical protein